MLVVDAAAQVKGRSGDARVFMWAALLHDIGKPGTTRVLGDRITSYNHEKLGSELSARFLRTFSCDPGFIRSVASLVRWHMQILFVSRAMPFADIRSMKNETSVNDVALLGYCDRIGRLGADERKELENIRLFLEKAGQ
jgi:putative nucleotidyltransferase with HDIG domain